MEIDKTILLDNADIVQRWANSILNDLQIKKLLEDDFKRFIATGESKIYSPELLKEIREHFKKDLKEDGKD